MSLSARDWLVEDLLMKADKMSMAASLESRVPFLSRELMEWCCTLPHEWKVGTSEQGFTTKRILREFSAKRLPREIIYREKMGFSTPVYEWLTDQLKGWAEYILFYQGLLEDWFDMQEVRNIFDKAMQNNFVHQHNLFLLIALAFWKKMGFNITIKSFKLETNSRPSIKKIFTPSQPLPLLVARLQ